jgi:chemotaxis protein histidine kinase CheA
MSQAMGSLDFFLLEAGEYLERLDALSQAPAGSAAPAEELVRLARAFRGSALMASQHGVSRAAQGLEAVSRALRDGRLAWDERVRGEVVRAVDDCKVLVRRLRQPDPADTEKAEALGAHLERLAGRPSAAARAAQAGLDAGARAFVAREAAAIASALQRTAQALATDPGHREPVGALVPAMSSLRGVAILSDLPPLGEILGAVEGAAKEVLGLTGPAPAAAAQVFDVAARALARAAREVVDTGRPDPQAEEARVLAAALMAAFTAPGDVVPVESLFYSDQGPHIVRAGAPPATGGLTRVEMVSQGEFLRAAATELRRATSPVPRDLRLFSIAAHLRPMVGGGGSPLASALSRLAESAREAIGRGGAGGDPTAFLAAMDEAADALSGAQSAEDAALAQRLIRAAESVAALAATTAAAPPSVPAPAAPAVEAAIPLAAPMAAAAEVADLSAGYRTFEQLLAERGLPLTSLDELLRGAVAPPAAAAARRPIATTRAVAPVPIEALAPEERVVPIESLLYRGDRALARILELKPQLVAAASGAGDGGASLNALLAEVFDLVELGRGAER